CKRRGGPKSHRAGPSAPGGSRDAMGDVARWAGTPSPRRQFVTDTPRIPPMSDFTYETPDEDQYMRAVLLVLKQRQHQSLYDKLKHAHCSIASGGSFSGRRWNAHHTSVSFHIPMQEFASYTFDEEDYAILSKVCDDVMPARNGLDVTDVAIAPYLGA